MENLIKFGPTRIARDAIERSRREREAEQSDSCPLPLPDIRNSADGDNAKDDPSDKKKDKDKGKNGDHSNADALNKLSDELKRIDQNINGLADALEKLQGLTPTNSVDSRGFDEHKSRRIGEVRRGLERLRTRRQAIERRIDELL